MTPPKSSAAVKPLPVALCFVAGYADVCAFIALFGTFIAQITGTYIVAGASLVTNDTGIVTKLLAIPVFMAGAAVATAICRSVTSRHPPPLAIALLIEAVLLTAFLFFGIRSAVDNDPGSAATFWASVAGFSAMGVQSALVRIFYTGAPSTNVMTTATSQIAIDATDVFLARRNPRIPNVEAAKRRLAETLPHVASFLIGALTGAVAFAALQWWSIVPVILIVLACCVATWRQATLAAQ